MKILLTGPKLLFQGGIIIIAWITLWMVLSEFFTELVALTPPGAQGLSAPFLVLVGLSLVLTFGFARWFRSSAPSVGAAFWMAAILSQIPYIDNRTFIWHPYATWWDLFRPVVCCGIVILLLLLGAVYLARV